MATVRVWGCTQQDNFNTFPTDPCPVNSGAVNQMYLDVPQELFTTPATECPEGHMCSIPELSFEEGVLIAMAIGGVWTLGLIARLYIRAAQEAMRP